MLREFSRACNYGPVKIGTEGGAMIEVVTDWHVTKGPKDVDLGDGKKIAVTVDEHDGYHARGSVDEEDFFDLVKTARVGLVVNGVSITILHEKRS